jgi:hypothetical protein
MATYYWTTEAEKPGVYHNDADCPEGKKILPKFKATSASRPSGHRLCEVCERSAGGRRA